jgi:hypothetical protein
MNCRVRHMTTTDAFSILTPWFRSTCCKSNFLFTFSFSKFALHFFNISSLSSIPTKLTAGSKTLSRLISVVPVEHPRSYTLVSATAKSAGYLGHHALNFQVKRNGACNHIIENRNYRLPKFKIRSSLRLTENIIVLCILTHTRVINEVQK